MNFQEVQQFLDQNKDTEEVKNYLSGLRKPTPEGVIQYLDTEEGKKLLQPKIDSHFTKGLETWKQNNLNKMIEEEIAKRNPGETPEQKKLRELEQKIADSEKKALNAELKNKAIQIATEKKLPLKLVEYMIGEDEAGTLSNLQALETIWTDTLKVAIEEKFKENGRDPHRDNDKFKGINPWKKETFNLTQQAKILLENPELAKTLQAQAK